MNDTQQQCLQYYTAYRGIIQENLDILRFSVKSLHAKEFKSLSVLKVPGWETSHQISTTDPLSLLY